MNEKFPKESQAQECSGSSRMNAKSVILDKAIRLHREAEALEAIANSIPWGMLHPRVEELLWNYFVSPQR